MTILGEEEEVVEDYRYLGAHLNNKDDIFIFNYTFIIWDDGACRTEHV